MIELRQKVLDHGYIEPVEFWGSDERVIESARMSVGRGFISWDAYSRCKKCDHIRQVGDETICEFPAPPGSTHDWQHYPNGDGGLLKTLYRNRHTTPFEMCGATFELEAPIMVYREWHRHRTQSYAEMSARYTPLPNTNYIPTKERCMFSGGSNKQAQSVEGTVLSENACLNWLESLEHAYAHCERTYQHGLKLGVPKELARLIVPVGRYSRMRASANLLNWIRFLTLRLPDSAQWEIRQYAGQVCEMLSSKFPKTMALFGEELISKA